MRVIGSGAQSSTAAIRSAKAAPVTVNRSPGSRNTVSPAASATSATWQIPSAVTAVTSPGAAATAAQSTRSTRCANTRAES